MMDRLRGKVAVLTGGGSGIGLAAARLFLAEGAEVAIWDRDPEPARTELGAGGEERIHFTRLDVRELGPVREAAAELHARAGRIDVLINNAGVTFGYLDLQQLSPKAWDAIVDTNLKGAVHCTQAIVPYMKRRRSGSIVNVSSVLARYGYPGQTAYVATKSALEGLTRVWARELGSFGIRVNAVRPGYIATPMNEKNPPEAVEEVLARTPLQRLGQPEEVTNVYLFLCSEEASFVTGAIVPVDGGFVP